MQTILEHSFLSNFLDKRESADLQLWLIEHVPWQVETFNIFGKRQNVPRLSAWYGDKGACYRYTGIDHIADGWPDVIWSLRQKIHEVCETQFNFVVLNRYRNGSDYMGWHRDAESGAHEQIASISLGAPRTFKIQAQTGVREFTLSDGSLLLFNGHLRHQLPKRLRQNGERVNLTFRTIQA